MKHFFSPAGQAGRDSVGADDGDPRALNCAVSSAINGAVCVSLRCALDVPFGRPFVRAVVRMQLANYVRLVRRRLAQQ